MAKNKTKVNNIAVMISGWILKEAERGNMLARAQTEIEKDISKGLGVILFDSNEPVAFCRLWPLEDNFVEIASLIVGSGKRHQGYGTRMIKEAFGVISNKFPKAKVFTLSRNKISQAFFAKIGGRHFPKESLPNQVWQLCFQKGATCPYRGQLLDCPCVPFDLTHLVKAK